MDPDALLKQIRERIRDIGFDQHDAGDELFFLAEDIANLDKWLCRGGFLPKDWQR